VIFLSRHSHLNSSNQIFSWVFGFQTHGRVKTMLSENSSIDELIWCDSIQISAKNSTLLASSRLR